MNAETEPAEDEGTGVSLARDFERFLGKLDETFRAFAGNEAVSPPMAVWIALDNPRRHRDFMGFRSRDKLLAAMLGRVGRHLSDKDFTAVAGESAVAVVLDAKNGERDFNAWGAKVLKDINSNLFDLDEQMVSITVSVGLSPFFARAKRSEEPLLKAARLAETVAASGGGRMNIQETRKTDKGISQDNREVLSLLVRSLKNNEVKVVFQPLVSVSGDDLARFQILPRLQSEDGTLLPASRFIPLAQRHGILPALDRWMLAWALKFISHNAQRGKNVVLFINQSSAMLEDEKLVDWLETRVKSSSGTEKGLVLEFRLDYLLSHLKEGRMVLERLIELGVGVGVTGVDEDSSSEVVLEHLPSNYLRMGPGFAHRMQGDEDLAHRYEKFADKAQATGRKLIIPMLENADEVARIWRARVDLVQGNFIQRPRETLDE